ncbi:Alg8p [Malassezia vespertilionis]|uniref:Alpha-1,3-glucosyltransferase n=1 Tax=Malassezia vespertilionis TaxID=2020962 RepID=A0A2N1JE70_9BASI|nr:Alg8p [Malassezia vespertilionis]
MTSARGSAVALGTLAKVLVSPAYHSTDMEVHRNWLAVTHTLPLREWYTDTTSPWTLDYPPFFAYLSWLLAQPAAWIDPNIVRLNMLDYASPQCKAYLRATVLLTELGLAYALHLHAQCTPSAPSEHALLLSVLLHPGLFMVDHIHFQYNGLLFGVLVFALWAARTQRPCLCALAFASLLNTKHIYLYVAPAFTVYLFRAYLWPAKGALRGIVRRTLMLGAATIAPFAASILPFAVDAEISALYLRLFPFHRGLLHAYWAPNVWALYAALDRVLLRGATGTAVAAAQVTSSRGIVGDTVFGVLPSVQPSACFLLAALPMLVYTAKLWTRPTYRALLLCVSLCALTAFAVGWHVHEKAILLVLVPLSLAAPSAYAYARAWELLSAAGIVSLFPLLHTPLETPVKLGYAAIWFVVVRHIVLRRVLRPMPSNAQAILHFLETQYMRGLCLLAVATNVGWPLLAASDAAAGLARYEFLPLLATSVFPLRTYAMHST